MNYTCTKLLTRTTFSGRLIHPRLLFFFVSQLRKHKTVRRTQAKNKQKGIRSSRSRSACVRARCVRVCSARLSAADWRARRPRAAQLAAAAAANGSRSRDAAPHACLQIIIIVPCLAGGAASTATCYAQLSLHLAGFDSAFGPSFDLFSGFRGVLSIGDFAPVMLATFSSNHFLRWRRGSYFLA